MKPSIKQIIEDNKDAFYRDLGQVIRIPSIKGPAKKGAPYGIENRRVLEKIMTLARSYGFNPRLVDDCVVYIQVGEEKDYLGIVGHLDVVEASGKWTSPPFELTKRAGKLFARGILDNKGPIFSCLFGLKLLLDNGYPINRTLRILFGTDEESGSSDMARYLKVESPPTFAFTPDCKYPVVYGERGILAVAYETEFTPDILKHISNIQGEQNRSFVPDYLSCQVEGQQVEGRGKRAPSNAPDMGENAITLLAKEIQQMTTITELKAYFSWIVDCLHQKHYGEGLNMHWQDSISGVLNVTPYFLEKTKRGFKLVLSIRYPVSYTETQVLNGLMQAAFDLNTKVTVVRSLPSVMHDKNLPEIQQLSQAYQKITGLDSTPVTTTGATYARFLPNTVAFGPSFPGQKGIAHNVDEYMDESDLLLNMEIYMQAILNLCN